MNKCKKNKNGAGFSLIEIVIYVAILAVITGGIIQYVLLVNTWHTRIALNIDINENIISIDNYLKAQLAQASQITAPLLGEESETLSFTSGGETVSIGVNDGILKDSRNEGTLTDSGLKINNLVFANLGNDNIDSIQYSFNIGPRVASSREYQISTSYQSAANRN